MVIERGHVHVVAQQVLRDRRLTATDPVACPVGYTVYPVAQGQAPRGEPRPIDPIQEGQGVAPNRRELVPGGRDREWDHHDGNRGDSDDDSDTRLVVAVAADVSVYSEFPVKFYPKHLDVGCLQERLRDVAAFAVGDEVTGDLEAGVEVAFRGCAEGIRDGDIAAGGLAVRGDGLGRCNRRYNYNNRQVQRCVRESCNQRHDGVGVLSLSL